MSEEHALLLRLAPLLVVHVALRVGLDLDEPRKRFRWTVGNYLDGTVGLR